MQEYWFSAQKASLKLLGRKFSDQCLTQDVPRAFRELRPWVHHGWEMVLLAAEILHTESQLCKQGFKSFAKNYSFHCNEALKSWSWEPIQLQTALEDVRRKSLINNKNNWLAMHHAFPGVVERFKALNSEEIDLIILTTKGHDFTTALLEFLDLQPKLVFGHESGSKSDILLELISNHTVIGFLEDRLTTLQKIRTIPELNSIPCYLASWGYLKPGDKESLGQNIHLLEKEKLASPLASWI